MLCVVGLTSQAKAATPSQVQVWRSIEIPIVVEGDISDKDAFHSVEVDVLFMGPSGERLVRPAFWADKTYGDNGGQQLWKVRFAPTAEGQWNYDVSVVFRKNKYQDWSIATDHASGQFHAVADPNETREIYKKGFLLGEGGERYVRYNDGTPFWWLSDDLSAVAKGRLHVSNKTEFPGWDLPIKNPDSQIKSIIDRRTEQGYSVLIYHFSRFWDVLRGDDGKPLRNPQGKLMLNSDDLPDNNFYDAIYDNAIEYTADQGLVSALVLDYGTALKHGYERTRAKMRYLVARYGAYPVVWSVAEPDAEIRHTEKHKDFIQPYFADAWGEQMHEITSLDAYKHPIGPWFRECARVVPPHYGLPRYYLPGEKGPFTASIGIIHSGHEGVQPLFIPRYYYDNYAMPFIDAGGSNFEQIWPKRTSPEPFDDNLVRKTAWRSVLSGSAGFGYGAQGIWNMQYDWDTPTFGNYTNIPWHVAIDFPGGQQVAYMSAFFRNLDWDRLYVKHEDWIISFIYSLWGKVEFTWFGEAVHDEWALPVVRTVENRSEGDLIVAYIPRDFKSTHPNGIEATIFGLLKKPYRAQWFNPRTGEYTLISNSIQLPRENGTWYVPATPDELDWVLLLECDG